MFGYEFYVDPSRCIGCRFLRIGVRGCATAIAACR